MKLLLLLTLLFATGATSVLAQDTLYYSILWKETTADKAAYFRLKTKTATDLQVSDHWLSGKTQMTGSYADDSFHIKEGEFVFYDTTGIANHRVTYVHNKLNGIDTYYYPNGKTRITGPDKDDSSEGNWIGYYPSGKISGKALFKKGQQVSAAFYHEDGSPNKTVTIFMREAEFPGGANHWLRFLNKNLRYPDSAVVYEIQGTVIVDFMVSKEGKAGNFRVSQSVNKYLDEEALRVMNQMPEWIPSISGGIATESYKRQPIVFSLQAQ
jgi:TonB family protein